MKNILKKINLFGIIGILITSGVVYAHKTNTISSSNLFAKEYYVIGEEEGNYILSDSPVHEEECDISGLLPCKITAETPLPEEVNKEMVDTQDGLTINSWRDSF